ncbi:unnamed protein product [Penicillium olsonii]|uniref:non-specific serine/threonine protein kinase n=1 Tax=Penicillium olsonii TaxID=99116 RepID=A0A9W4IHT3_PENOL|nr:unnamed protein product [Penicillium olsonii]CAG8283763.1 unnamed protein product [Penicillium olsonii]
MSHPRSRSPSLPSEGEIVEPGPGMKATASKLPLNGTNIDRPPRASPSLAPRSPTSLDGHHSPPYRSSRARSPTRSRSRSPYREHPGHRRRHGDSHNDPADRYPRYEPSQRYRSHADNRPHHQAPNSHRIRPYHDYDREEPYGDGLRYSDDHDQRRDKRQRTRSRSPYREARRPRKYSSDDHSSKVDHGRPTEKLMRDRAKESAAPESKRGAEKRENQVQASSGRQAYVSNEELHPNPEIVQVPEAAEPVNEADALEARRKRREAIRAKYQNQASPANLQPPLVGESETEASTPGNEPINTKMPDSSREFPQQPADLKHASNNDQDTEMAHSGTSGDTSQKDGQSAIDGHPAIDMKEEVQKHTNVQIEKNDISSAAYDELDTAIQDHPLPVETSAPVTMDAGDFDMFADGDDDMFAEENDQPRPAPGPTAAVPRGTQIAEMVDEWDDSQGYYNIRLGELMDKRYHVQEKLGRGTFAAVVRARDAKTGNLVAIKIIRHNHTMRKEGLKEIEVLELLQKTDPEGKRHVIKLDRHFEHKGHLCLVFENLHMDLRELLKKFGKNVGLNLRAIRVYGQQIFLALSLLRQCNLIHADLKPDNMLVNEQRNLLKICDLGSAFPATDAPTAPYLASRFYRAPEIMLGIPFDFAVDVWAIGCTLYELYAGHFLFTGRDNNQMIRSILETRGNYPPKLLRRGSLRADHFSNDSVFASWELNTLTDMIEPKPMDFKKPKRDLKTRLMGQGTRGMPEAEVKELSLFVDFLDRCLALNPEKRITPNEALVHPFLARLL